MDIEVIVGSVDAKCISVAILMKLVPTHLEMNSSYLLHYAL